MVSGGAQNETMQKIHKIASLRRPWRTETVLKTSSPMPPYYSYEHALSWQICSTSHSICVLGSRSTRFAASAERKLIFKVPQKPGEPISLQKSCSSRFLNFCDISEGSNGENRISQAVFMLGDDSKLI